MDNPSSSAAPKRRPSPKKSPAAGSTSASAKKSTASKKPLAGATTGTLLCASATTTAQDGAAGVTMSTKAHLLVSGKVQGVYYRDSCLKKGRELGLIGAAFNLKDGSGRVEVFVEGSKGEISKFIEWAHLGPEGAKQVGITDRLVEGRRVDKVEVQWLERPDLDWRREFGEKFFNGGNKREETKF